MTRFPNNDMRHPDGLKATERSYQTPRERMVEQQIVERGIRDQRVTEAMRAMPRHLFVEDALRYMAYADHSLPIGEKQTISQPYMVALMTECLELTGSERVLEIGTGSGYQTALLSILSERVYSVERMRSLSLRARKILDELKCGNVLLRIGDGTRGWPEHAPYDRVLVSAGCVEVPEALVDQMAEGGIIVIPIGGEEEQVLQKGIKEGSRLKLTPITGCTFVKLIGEFGWSK